MAPLRKSNQLDRQSINLKLNQSLLNDNVIITLWHRTDFNISSSAVQSGNFQWLPDISVEFVLSRDRKLRAIVFNRSSLDVNAGIIGRRIRQGISISYSPDFPREDDRPVLIDTSSTPAVNRSRKTQNNNSIFVPGAGANSHRLLRVAQFVLQNTSRKVRKQVIVAEWLSVLSVFADFRTNYKCATQETMPWNTNDDNQNLRTMRLNFN